MSPEVGGRRRRMVRSSPSADLALDLPVSSAWRATARVSWFLSAEEFSDTGKYICVFDPLDGSSDWARVGWSKFRSRWQSKELAFQDSNHLDPPE